MLPTLAEKPFDSPDWLFETKWDGVRAICAITKSEVHAVSRTGYDLVSQFPELAKLRAMFKTLPMVIDGEIVSLDRKGRSSFQRLQPRINRLRGTTDARIPITFVVFDVLLIGADDIGQEPPDRRKELVKKKRSTSRTEVVFTRDGIREGVKPYEKAGSRETEG